MSSHDDGARGTLLAATPVVERRMDLAGISTAVLIGGTGPPIVLLHGPGEFALTWLRVIPELVKTHLVIVPDLPGHGASGIGEAPLDADRVLAWLGELIEQTCPSPPYLAGHLLGGAIGSRDRFLRQCFVDMNGLREQLGSLWPPLMAGALEGANSPLQKQALRSMLPEFGWRPIDDGGLARISVPTSLIWGRQDRQTPLSVAERASSRFGWPLHVIEDAADDPAFEQPEAVLKALAVALTMDR